METIDLNKMIDVYANYPTDGGVFSPMANAPWVGKMTGLNLDIAYLDGHSGERFCSNIISRRLDDSDVLSSDNRTLIANILWAMFGIQWTRLWATMNPNYEPLTNYKMTEDETGTHTDTRTPDLTRKHTGTDKDEGSTTLNTQNNLWGFNSESSIPSDMQDGTNTANSTNTRDLTDTETGTDVTAGENIRKLTRTGNIGTNTFQNLLQQERNLWMYDFFEQVFKDVDSILTIPIY